MASDSFGDPDPREREEGGRANSLIERVLGEKKGKRQEGRRSSIPRRGEGEIRDKCFGHRI